MFGMRISLENGEEYKPGDILECNGAKLIYAKKYNPGSLDDWHFYIVMCQWKEDEFVTWVYRSDKDYCFWGHYYKDRQEAFYDYLKRRC